MTPAAPNSGWQDPGFFAMEGHDCCRTWIEHAENVEWNGWWRYLNANEKGAGFVEMGDVLYSWVVIWNRNLFSQVTTSWWSRKQDQGTAALPVPTLWRSEVSIYRNYLKCRKHWYGRKLHRLQLCSAVNFTSFPVIIINLSFIRLNWIHKLRRRLR